MEKAWDQDDPSRDEGNRGCAYCGKLRGERFLRPGGRDRNGSGGYGRDGRGLFALDQFEPLLFEFPFTPLRRELFLFLTLAFTELFFILPGFERDAFRLGLLLSTLFFLLTVLRFEDEAIARQMNEGFVCIKVDREERPDVDDMYMAATVITTGHGGWPMSVWLEPKALKPIVCGTYFLARATAK